MAGANPYGAPPDPYASFAPMAGPHPYAQQPNLQYPQAGNPWVAQPGPYPQHPAMQPGPLGPPSGHGQGDFMTGFASNMLKQSGENYFQRGQAFMQSRMGFLSSEALHYYFNINSQYVQSKLLMLLAPFLRRWNYTRVLEQIAGGQKYLPPRQDVNAPDLYIPLMAAATYSLLVCASSAYSGKFKTDLMYTTASGVFGAWMLHVLLMKVMFWMLGIASAAPFLELTAYAGYPFVPVVLAAVAGPGLGRWGWRTVWAYGSLCMAVFFVRTMKRIIFHESRQYRIDGSMHNYLLLGLALFQFPFAFWLGIRPLK